MKHTVIAITILLFVVALVWLSMLPTPAPAAAAPSEQAIPALTAVIKPASTATLPAGLPQSQVYPAYNPTNDE